MISNRCFEIPLAGVVILSLAGVGQAATVSFSSAAFDNVSQVSTAGTLIEAWNLGAGSDGDDIVSNSTTGPSPGNVTMNGVTFVADDATNLFFVDAAANDWRRPNYQTPGGPEGTVAGLSDADGQAFFHSYERNQANGRGAIDGLTIGSIYEVQLFIDRNNGSSLHTAGYAANPGDNVTESITEFLALHPVVLTGTFTADNTIQELFLYEDSFNGAGGGDGAGVGEISGFQLRLVRAVPEPATLVLIGSAIAGIFLLRRC